MCKMYAYTCAARWMKRINSQHQLQRRSHQRKERGEERKIEERALERAYQIQRPNWIGGLLSISLSLSLSVSALRPLFEYRIHSTPVCYITLHCTVCISSSSSSSSSSREQTELRYHLTCCPLHIKSSTTTSLIYRSSSSSRRRRLYRTASYDLLSCLMLSTDSNPRILYSYSILHTPQYNLV